MNRFIPSLAHLCALLRPLLRKDAEWQWRTEHENACSKIKEAIKEITAIKHFQRDAPTRIICDPSKEGLGAVLQQKPGAEWVTTHFALRFLTEFEKKYSMNELELLAVVWFIAKF